MLTELRKQGQKVMKGIKEATQSHGFVPAYKLVEIVQEAPDQYQVVIQVINKNVTFTSKPEEILAKDDMVDAFSPRDIRTLTYLGYLGVNSPKYRILAQRLSAGQDQVVFAIRDQQGDEVTAKTAAEIINAKDIIDNLPPQDARIVGYTAATESIQREHQEMQRLRQQRVSPQQAELSLAE